MPNPITQAQPPLEFLEPEFNPLVYKATQLLQPTWMRWQAKIADVEVSNPEALVDLYRQFQNGKIRFMMAFRHPSTNDPLCMSYLLANHLGKVAKQKGVKLQSPIHAHFIYDRGIPLWAGKAVGWYYSKMGCTPIRRGKVDLVGLRSIRQLFTSGKFPMAAAPEGATNGHNEIISPIEPGIAQFGFWCIEDLIKAGRSEQVMILPIGLQYHYLSTPWEAIASLLTQLEADSGVPPCSEADLKRDAEKEGMVLTGLDAQQVLLYRRLIRLGEHLLPLVEQFYKKFYHQDLSPSGKNAPLEPLLSTNQNLSDRLQILMNAALNVAEQHFAIAPKGTITDRCRRLEQAGWDWIYRDDLKQDHLSLVEKGLADRIAEEASLRLWHMRLVESFVSVTGRYVIEKPTGDRFAEILLIFWDMVTRIKGQVPFPRPQLGEQGVKITIGEPISVSDRWEAYQGSRRQAVAGLTQDLQTALESMIF